MRKFVIWMAVVVIGLLTLVVAGCGGTQTGNRGASTSQSPSGGQSPSTSQGASGDQSVASLLAKGAQAQGMSYDYSLTGGNASASGKMWVSGSKFRSEVTTAGQKVVMIFDGTTLYSCMPAQNMAVKMGVPMGRKVQTPLDYTNQIGSAGSLKTLDTVTYDGVRCKVIQYGGPNSGQGKVWVREDDGLPVRIETTSGGATTVMEFKNLAVAAQPDNLFQLPAGAQVSDIGNMPKPPGTSQ